MACLYPIPMYCVFLDVLLLILTTHSLLNLGHRQSFRLKVGTHHCRCLRRLSIRLPHSKLDSVFFVFCVSLVDREIIRRPIILFQCTVVLFTRSPHPNETFLPQYRSNQQPPLTAQPLSVSQDSPHQATTR